MTTPPINYWQGSLVDLAALNVPGFYAVNAICAFAFFLLMYHFGVEAGQGLAGIDLFISVFLLMMAVDSIIHFVNNLRRKHRLL